MPLTPQEQAEMQALEMELGGSTPKGGLTPAEQAEMQQLEAELGQMPKPQEAQAVPEKSGLFGKDQAIHDLKGIATRTAQGAASAVPGGNLSMLGAQGGVGMNLETLGAGSADLLNTGLAALTGGASIPAMAKAGAVVEGSGLGPLARKASKGIMNLYEPKFQNEYLNLALNAPKFMPSLAVEALPAFLVGKAGIGQIPTKAPMPDLPEALLKPEVTSMPQVDVMAPAPNISGKVNIPKTITGKLKLTPEQSGQVQAMESRLGVKLTRGQIEELIAPGSESKIRDFEFRTAKSQPAVEAQAKQMQAWEVMFGKGLEGVQKGSSKATPTSVGSEIQNKLSSARANAKAEYKRVADYIKEAPEGNMLNKSFSKNIQKAIDSVISEEGLNRPESRAAFGQVLKEVNALKNDAKAISNFRQATNFYRALNKWSKASKDRLGMGQGDSVDRIAGMIARETKEAIKTSASEKAGNADLVSMFDKASGDYWATHFAPEAKTLKKVTGIEGDSFSKTPEAVTAAFSGTGANDFAAMMGRAEGLGIASKADATKAAIAMLKDKAYNPMTDKTATGKLVKAWDDMAPSQKNQLFGDGVKSIEQAINDLKVLTYTERYSPPTGYSLPKLLPWMQKVPGGGILQAAAPVVESVRAKVNYGLNSPAYKTAKPDFRIGPNLPPALLAAIKRNAGSLGAEGRAAWQE